ncbi:unnamed protein product [Onchocerca ochengi]|uniref:Uncharacterized protein n=2 Tax=Onchocerca TaxID=6281 RepID=A0A182EPE6_ONCOC|nr:unnamed protein product [Onchocerca ochengi]
MDVGRGEEFDDLYAKEREVRSRSEQSRQKRVSLSYYGRITCRITRKRREKQEVRDMERVDVRSIEDVLRKRLKGEKKDGQYQQRDDTASYRSDKVGRLSDRSDKVDRLSDKSSSRRGMKNYRNRQDRYLQEMKKEEKKPSKFRAKLHELSMSPRAKRQKELGRNKIS